MINALRGTFFNHHTPHIYFADTIDPDYITSILQLCEKQLEQNKNIVVVVVSKSGTTTETIINAQLFIELLKKYNNDSYHDYVVTITDENSSLWNLSQECAIACLPIPKDLGGRFSVLSAVGLFPLALVGIDIDQLCQGARDMFEWCTKADESNPAARSALFLFEQYNQGKPIHDTFLFAHALEGVGKWYRQLMAESIGKNKNVGITPTVSIGTVDLHSVAQLYLAGPNDKITTFITIKQWAHDLTIPQDPNVEKLVPHVGGKSMAHVLSTIVHGVQKAYVQQNRPFATIELPALNAYYIGQLLQLKMAEIIYLASLFEVNPFDQPQVELYKKETRKILANE